MIAQLNRLRNPNLEEQALARIHRLGQKKAVKTLRFVMRDSFEEVRLQKEEGRGVIKCLFSRRER